MLKEFKNFAMKGNVLDLAVGIILGVAFGSIISSLVDDILMPPVGLLLGNVDFSNLFLILREGAVAGPYASVSAAAESGAITMNYGLFINTLVNFTIVAFAMFLLIKATKGLQKEEPEALPATKKCPYCFSAILVEATRCAFCTSQLITD
ncbi:MAG: large conductance mechanosensitive channel protein MscL [Anaerolineaceae bacterium]|nr:large conductance mechanosensitive channel protein MscL [Anaerolineaceae bacterium]